MMADNYWTNVHYNLIKNCSVHILVYRVLLHGNLRTLLKINPKFFLDSVKVQTSTTWKKKKRKSSEEQLEFTKECTGMPFLIAIYYRALQILCFLQTEDLWWSHIKQDYWCHFSNSIYLFHTCVSHIGNSHNIWCFFIMTICYDDLWSMIFDVTAAIVLGHQKLRTYKTWI